MMHVCVPQQATVLLELLTKIWQRGNEVSRHEIGLPNRGRLRQTWRTKINIGRNTLAREVLVNCLSSFINQPLKTILPKHIPYNWDQVDGHLCNYTRRKIKYAALRHQPHNHNRNAHVLNNTIAATRSWYNQKLNGHKNSTKNCQLSTC
jgi:hypothetical protein